MDKYLLAAAERLTTREPEKYQQLSAQPLTPVIGAEVSGLDLSKELTAEQLAIRAVPPSEPIVTGAASRFTCWPTALSTCTRRLRAVAGRPVTLSVAEAVLVAEAGLG